VPTARSSCAGIAERRSLLYGAGIVGTAAVPAMPGTAAIGLVLPYLFLRHAESAAACRRAAGTPPATGMPPATGT
jgi:hypothetical protein